VSHARTWSEDGHTLSLIEDAEGQEGKGDDRGTEMMTMTSHGLLWLSLGRGSPGRQQNSHGRLFAAWALGEHGLG
jgi:phenylpropionate dioxygenase-like ring-hydroxylating dioxygenase large terminal subunit